MPDWKAGEHFARNTICSSQQLSYIMRSELTTACLVQLLEAWLSVLFMHDARKGVEGAIAMCRAAMHHGDRQGAQCDQDTADDMEAVLAEAERRLRVTDWSGHDHNTLPKYCWQHICNYVSTSSPCTLKSLTSAPQCSSKK